jgi:hypothetical protein
MNKVECVECMRGRERISWRGRELEQEGADSDSSQGVQDDCRYGGGGRR